MTLIEARRKIRELGQAVVDTSDAAARLGVDRNHASKVLTRLRDQGELVQLHRGTWALSGHVDRLEVPEHLATPSPSYISLQTALFYRGLVSQIPEVTYAVTTGRTRRYETPMGTFSLHHMEPEFFFGFETTGDRSVKMASAEKALVDLLYFSPARSRLFAALPEVELPRDFSVETALSMIDRIPFESRRMHARRRFESVLRGARKLKR
jgi:predicted transcriptional regulator of viral defense system